MELPTSVLDPLSHIGSLTPERFSELVDVTFDGLLEDDAPTLNEPLEKTLLASLMTLIVESFRQNVGVSYTISILEERGMTNDQKMIFKTKFEAHAGRLKDMLKSLGPQKEPIVVDVEWKLNYLTKSNKLETDDDLSYLLKLKTLQETQDSIETEDIQFTCSVHQLQDLLSKLKEAYKNVEKLSTVTNV